MPTVCVRVRDQDGSALGPDEVEKDGVVFYCHELPNPTPKYEDLGYYSQYVQEAEEETGSGALEGTASSERVFVRILFEADAHRDSASTWLESLRDSGPATWVNTSNRYPFLDVDISSDVLKPLSERDGFQNVGPAINHYLYDPRGEPNVELDSEGNPVPPTE